MQVNLFSKMLNYISHTALHWEEVTSLCSPTEQPDPSLFGFMRRANMKSMCQENMLIQFDRSCLKRPRTQAETTYKDRKVVRRDCPIA